MRVAEIIVAPSDVMYHCSNITGLTRTFLKRDYSLVGTLIDE